MEVLGVRLGRKMARSLHHKAMSMWFNGSSRVQKIESGDNGQVTFLKHLLAVECAVLKRGLQSDDPSPKPQIHPLLLSVRS